MDADVERSDVDVTVEVEVSVAVVPCVTVEGDAPGVAVNTYAANPITTRITIATTTAALEIPRLAL